MSEVEQNQNQTSPIEEVKKDDEVIYLSASRINAYLSCPHHFKLAFIDKVQVDVKGGYHLALGNGIHKVLEDFYRDKIWTLERLEESWHAVCYKGSIGKRGEKDKMLPILEDPQYEWQKGDDEKKIFYFHGRKLLREYFHTNKHEFAENTVLKIEHYFKIPIAGGKIILNGYIDRIDMTPEGDVLVIDYKTGKEKSDEELDDDVQLTLYSFAVRKGLGYKERLLYLYQIKTGKKLYTRREKRHFDVLLEKIRKVSTGIRNKEFPATVGPMCQYCKFECPLNPPANGISPSVEGK